MVFLGKVLIGQGAIEGGNFVLLGLGFLSSLVVLYSLLRIFLSSFFGETIISLEDEKPLPRRVELPVILLALCTIALGIGQSGYHHILRMQLKRYIRLRYI